MSWAPSPEGPAKWTCAATPGRRGRWSERSGPIGGQTLTDRPIWSPLHKGLSVTKSGIQPALRPRQPRRLDRLILRRANGARHRCHRPCERTPTTASAASASRQRTAHGRRSRRDRPGAAAGRMMDAHNKWGRDATNARPRGTRSDSSRRVGHATSVGSLAESLSRSLQQKGEPMQITLTDPEARALLDAGELSQDVHEARGLPIPTPLRAALVRLAQALKGGA